MPIQVDVWGGDLHLKHLGAFKSEDWEEVFELVEEQVEAGMLCNVLHTDFIDPPDKVRETNLKLLSELSSKLQK